MITLSNENKTHGTGHGIRAGADRIPCRIRSDSGRHVKQILQQIRSDRRERSGRRSRQDPLKAFPRDRHTQRRQWPQDLQRGKKQRFLIRSDADQEHEEAKIRKKYGFFVAIRSASTFRTESVHQARGTDPEDLTR